jgi:hypothetical protein
MFVSLYVDERSQALDIELPWDILESKNLITMIVFYKQLEKFMETLIKNIDTYKIDSPVFQSMIIENIAYSLSLFSKEWKNYLRIKFNYRNPWDGGASMEAVWYLISRKAVENPLLPDFTDFKKVLEGI